MKNFYLFLFILFFGVSYAFAGETILKSGISIDKVPKDLYGTWRVSAKLTSTNSEGIFKNSSVDLWNLSRLDNVITLDNPFSGANSSIIVNAVEGRSIKFKRVGDYDGGKKLTDTVQLNLGKDTFVGVNNLKLDTISNDGHVMKTQWAEYSLKGEKISGESINIPQSSKRVPK